jgi:hypothetical protein
MNGIVAICDKTASDLIGSELTHLKTFVEVKSRKSAFDS